MFIIDQRRQKRFIIIYMFKQKDIKNKFKRKNQVLKVLTFYLIFLIAKPV